MKADAEMNAEDDRKQYELVTARNEGESMCYQVEKTMSENADKLSDDDKGALTEAIEKVRETSKEEDVDAIKGAVKELEQASHALSKAMYESAQAEGGAGDAPADAAAEGGDAGASASEDDAIDAEFEVKNG